MANWKDLNAIATSVNDKTKPISAETNDENQVINNAFNYDVTADIPKGLPVLDTVAIVPHSDQPAIESEPVKITPTAFPTTTKDNNNSQGIMKLAKWLVIVFVLVNLIILGAIVINSPTLGLKPNNQIAPSASTQPLESTLTVPESLTAVQTAMSGKYYQITSSGSINFAKSTIQSDGVNLNYQKGKLYSVQTVSGSDGTTTGIKVNERVIFTSNIDTNTAIIVNDLSKKYANIPASNSVFYYPLETVLQLEPAGQVGSINGDGSLTILVPTSELVPEQTIQADTPQSIKLRIWLNANDLIVKVQALSTANTDLGTITFQYQELLAKDSVFSGYDNYNLVDYQQWVG